MFLSSRDTKVDITQTCLCNILRYFTTVKMVIFGRKNVIFFLFLLKTLIVGTSMIVGTC